MPTAPQLPVSATRGPRPVSARRSLAATAVLLTGLLALAACTPAKTPVSGGANYELTATTPAPTGQLDSFTWSIYAEPASLDYAHAFDYPDNQVLSNVCESLLRWNADLSVSPGLAEKWDNPTPTTWVYSIRPGVTFHDGTPLTAADVVASLKRHLDPAAGSYWNSAYTNVSSIEQTGEMQVTVTTTIPDSQFNLSMASSPGTVESAATLARDGADYGNSTAGVNCTGPFSLGKWDSGEAITLERYDAYWDKNLVAKSKQVKFVFLSDPNTRVNAFKSGEVDGGWMIPSNAIGGLEVLAERQNLLRHQHSDRERDRHGHDRPARRCARPEGTHDGDRPPRTGCGGGTGPCEGDGRPDPPLGLERGPEGGH